MLVDREPYIFEDGIARRLLDEQGETMIGYHRSSGSHPILAGTRLAVTVRSRFAEERLAAAVPRGIDQYVILAAGLDTFAYRSPLAERITVYELDAPVTQQWKLARMAEAAVEARGVTRHVPVDLRTDDVIGRLEAAGLDSTRPAFVSWLGASFYLDQDALDATLRALGRLAPATEIVFDYVLAPHLRDEDGETYSGFAKPVAAQSGEPWLSELDPDQMAGILNRAGFEVSQQTGQRDSID
ncbi:MAG TPA: SAM-dependent methyltransferase, partial [Candidatus Sulfotelmatobacter sp.]|nr:SAM-dependent methyltransferase [Candidatus Sulfotelmatobacter sp.]